MTPTQLALAVDRLAKAANPAVIPGVDYHFGATRAELPPRPTKEEDETIEAFRLRMEAYRNGLPAWREANPPVWEIQAWDETKLGQQPSKEAIEAEAEKPDASSIILGEQWVTGQGFDADRKVTLLDMLLQAKEADSLSTKPKLISVYQWMQTVKAMAVAGSTEFPQAPHTFMAILQESTPQTP